MHLNVQLMIRSHPIGLVSEPCLVILSCFVIRNPRTDGVMQPDLLLLSRSTWDSGLRRYLRFLK